METASIYFTNVITIASNGPNSNEQFSINQASDQIAFDVTVSDPCSASNAEAVVFHDNTASVITSITIVNGNAVDVTIKAPTNAFATSEGVIDRCGSMSAAVFTDNDGTDTSPSNSWATVSGPDFATGDYTLHLDTKLALSLIGTNPTTNQVIYVKTVLKLYTTQKQYTAFTVTINEATCDCTSMLWTAPSVTAVTARVAFTTTETFPLPVQDTSNSASNGAFAKCFLAGGPGCASTGTFPIGDVKYDDGSASGIALPSWFEIT